MRRKMGCALAIAVAVGASPLRADVSAQYLNRNGRPSVTIEVDEHGHMRVGGLGGYYLATPSGEYFVDPGPGGPRVISLDAAIVLAGPELEARKPWPPSTWHFEPVGTAQVGPWTGIAYRAVGELPPLPPTAVISDDPRLAPVGLAQLRAARADHAAARAPNADEDRAPLLSQGALLSTSYSTLGSVSFEPIAAERFALPAKPITLADVAGAATEAEPYDPNDPEIIQAAFSGGELWTLDDRGELGRTPEGSLQRIATQVPDYAVSICGGPEGLWLATQRELGEPVRLWVRSQGAAWQAHGEVPVSSDAWLVGTECASDRPLLLFSDKLVSGERIVPLKLTELPRRLVALPRSTGRATGLVVADERLYVSINNGEWGGGIQRIDLRRGETWGTGHVEFICVHARHEDVCSGVSGLAPDPVRRGCLLASLGTTHGVGSRGEVIRVCGTAAERIYRKPYTMNPDWTPDDAGEPFNNSVAFWRMTGGAGAAWALGDDGVYRFSASERPELRAFPPVPLNRIDWSQPGIVVVPTRMNRNHPFGSASFLLAAR